MSALLQRALPARPMLVVLGLLAIFVAALAPSVPAARALPPAGTDVLRATGQVSLVSRLGQETISLSGTVTIQRTDPQMDGAVEVVSAEIVSLSLGGESLTGPVTVSESATRTSSGEIRSLQPPPNQFPASSFFDVYIVVEAPASPSPTITLHNEEALHLVPMSGGSEVSLSEWPPDGVKYRAEPDPCIPLLPTLPKEVCLTSLSIVLGPLPVGGAVELPDVAGAAAEMAGSSRPGVGVLAGTVAGAAAAVALGGAAWYARRRVGRR